MSAARGSLEIGEFGQWKIYAKAPGHPPLDVSWFRDAAAQVGDWSRQDPFGPVSLEITFPAVTIFDKLGAGGLFWVDKHVDFDLMYVGDLPAGYPHPWYAWEGYSESFEYSNKGVKITLKGCAYQLDHYQAKPEYPVAPFPYEYAMARQWHDRPDLRLGSLHVVWPSWWDTTYKADPKAPVYKVPAGVKDGEKWSGLVTRRTGSWEPALSSYIQTLMSGMYTHRGRWTWDLHPGRKPVLMHRDYKYEADATTIVLEASNPTVKFNLTQDWSQSMNVVYGAGKSLNGEGYSGMQVTNDGQTTTYAPLAAMRQVHPTTDVNGWLESKRMRKEIQLQLPEGLTAEEARKVASSHLQHFSDPGLMGTIELTGDVRLGGPDGDLMSRALILEGMSVQFKGVFGHEQGVMLHIAGVNVQTKGGTVTLTVDSKFRDALTLEEAQVRGRDSLNTVRQLIGGLYEPPIPDSLVPWNYAEGSGFIPSSEKKSSQRLFDGMPSDIEFPWTEWTTQRPPRSPSFKDCYVRIGPASATDSNKNWAVNPTRDPSVGAGFGYGFPIKMAQAGTIRLLQLAAYDADGNVLNVPFHFSLYYSNGVNVQSMPRIPADQSGMWGPGAPAAGFIADDATHLQHYPFHNNAWERFFDNGTERGPDVVVSVESAGLIRGWGTGPAKAGYWPGASYKAADSPTGMLVDEEQFPFSPVTSDKAANQTNPYSTIQKSYTPGYLYGMIYCDAQGDQDVYFAGRMFRVEPGTST